MGLPIQLSYGLISIYHVRQRSLVYNFPSPPDCNWGSIYQISPYGITYSSVGQQVLFKGTDAVCRLAIRNKVYPVIHETSVIATEL